MELPIFRKHIAPQTGFEHSVRLTTRVAPGKTPTEHQTSLQRQSPKPTWPSHFEGPGGGGGRSGREEYVTGREGGSPRQIFCLCCCRVLQIGFYKSPSTGPATPVCLYMSVAASKATLEVGSWNRDCLAKEPIVLAGWPFTENVCHLCSGRKRCGQNTKTSLFPSATPLTTWQG